MKKENLEAYQISLMEHGFKLSHNKVKSTYYLPVP